MSTVDRSWLRLLAPLVLMAVIFYFSAQPASGHHPWWELVLRKAGHITGYALLTAAWCWALAPHTRNALRWALAISFLYACTDEFHQHFVRGRFGSPVDVGIDSIGMAIAALLVRWRAGSGRAMRPRARSSPVRSP